MKRFRKRLETEDEQRLGISPTEKSLAQIGNEIVSEVFSIVKKIAQLIGCEVDWIEYYRLYSS